ncbi:MAG TPA: sugar phosphate isomerase/epimerase [Dehalococcoidia bacterium]|nr:sugar phosphate isomerase/epimerase [Dehalococcoidia bacterium]
MIDRLVASYWTLAGAPVPEPARWTFEARVRAAAQAGFWGIGLLASDYVATRERGYTDAELLRLIESYGIVVDEVEFLSGWSSDDEATRARALEAETQLFAAADAFGARQLNAGCSEMLGELPDVERVAERFGALCERAAAHGLSVAIEFLLWSGIPDATSACEIARRAGKANGGVLLDTWHFFRGNPSIEALRAIPAERIVGLQVNDGPAQPVGAIRDETRHGRRLPGEGEFDLVGLISVLGAMGVNAPWGIEVMSDLQASLPLAAEARAAFDSTTAVLEKALKR